MFDQGRRTALYRTYPQRSKGYHDQQNRSSRPHHSRSPVHPFFASGSLAPLLAHPRCPSALFKEIIYCLLFDTRWFHFLRTVSYTVYSRCRIQSRTALQLIEKDAARIFQSPAKFFGPYIHRTLDSTMEMWERTVGRGGAFRGRKREAR